MNDDIAWMNFVAENQIRTLTSDEKRIFYFDVDEYTHVISGKPWTRDVHHFQRVLISALALVKMVRFIFILAFIYSRHFMQNPVEILK